MVFFTCLLHLRSTRGVEGSSLVSEGGVDGAAMSAERLSLLQTRLLVPALSSMGVKHKGGVGQSSLGSSPLPSNSGVHGAAVELSAEPLPSNSGVQGAASAEADLDRLRQSRERCSRRALQVLRVLWREGGSPGIKAACCVLPTLPLNLDRRRDFARSS